MKETLEKILSDWRVYDYEEKGGCYELEAWSPEGEDIIIILRGSTLAELAHDAYEAWADFDADEHAAEIYTAKHSGNEDAQRFYAAAPDSLRDLLKDAEAIRRMYKSVHKKLEKAARKAA